MHLFFKTVVEIASSSGQICWPKQKNVCTHICVPARTHAHTQSTPAGAVCSLIDLFIPRHALKSEIYIYIPIDSPMQNIAYKPDALISRSSSCCDYFFIFFKLAFSNTVFACCQRAHHCRASKKVSLVEVISFSSAEVLGRPLAGGLKKHFAKEPCQPTRQRHYLEELKCEKSERACFRVYKHTKKCTWAQAGLYINKHKARMNLAD